MFDGFQPGRSAEPIAGVFDVVRVHGRALRILFICTVLEVRWFGYKKVTSCATGTFTSLGRKGKADASLHILFEVAQRD